jgi:hypothetical protein
MKKKTDFHLLATAAQASKSICMNIPRPDAKKPFSAARSSLRFGEIS